MHGLKTTTRNFLVDFSALWDGLDGLLLVGQITIEIEVMRVLNAQSLPPSWSTVSEILC